MAENVHLLYMSWFRESQDHLPLTWWKGRPIYLAALLALAGAASMIFTAIAGYGAMDALVFSYSNLVGRLYLWTPLTYTLVNPPNLWVIVGCFLMWRFGEELERHLGRRSFVWLVAGLWVIPPLLITLMGMMGGAGRPLMGLNQLQFGIFVAFAALYPRAQISLLIVNVEAWVLAAVFVGIAALADLASRDWSGLICLAGAVAFAVGFVRYEQGQLNWTSFRPTLPKPRMVRRPVQRTAAPKPKPASIQRGPEVDEILEKISREGIHSLTEEERNVLARASDDLQKRKR